MKEIKLEDKNLFSNDFYSVEMLHREVKNVPGSDG